MIFLLNFITFAVQLKNGKRILLKQSLLANSGTWVIKDMMSLHLHFQIHACVYPICNCANLNLKSLGYEKLLFDTWISHIIYVNICRTMTHIYV